MSQPIRGCQVLAVLLLTSVLVGFPLKIKASSLVNFNQIEGALKSGKFEQANQETLKAVLSMEETANKEGQFPCNDLQTLEQLWQKYTQGVYGFKAQAEIWDRVNQQEKEKNQQQQYWIGDVVNRFCQELGWISCGVVYGEINFKLSAQKGYLPTTILSLADNGYNQQGNWKSNQETFSSDDWLFLELNPGMVESLAGVMEDFYQQVQQCKL
ncbi:GUN4 domain-containing protein [Gloeothece verrucosa]|uniref:GUN4 domain protein n=1 Tax=Gloeothece verrucosa (strain PCC 7822) TaxID=497965 RepID=E0UN29_GLOV7|nr:GUN4 domain-containing protein [Gloeothece verrucosa]ADN18359.1 GUN4 domain protein [Gloeothece verrucosa PCC 7822]